MFLYLIKESCSHYITPFTVRISEKFESPENSGLSIFWSEIRESNPCPNLGKVMYYHYTNLAFLPNGAIVAYFVEDDKNMDKGAIFWHTMKV
jgi:hypothetical protein